MPRIIAIVISGQASQHDRERHERAQRDAEHRRRDVPRRLTADTAAA